MAAFEFQSLIGTLAAVIAVPPLETSRVVFQSLIGTLAATAVKPWEASRKMFQSLIGTLAAWAGGASRARANPRFQSLIGTLAALGLLAEAVARVAGFNPS